MSDEVNEVTQADIDAAEEHYPPLFWKKAARDDLALAFARYRTAFQASAGECRSNQAAYEELRRFAQNIFNGLDTSMIRMDTPADETLANVLRRGRAALATLTTPVEASQPVGDAGEGRWYDDVSLGHALRSALWFAASRSAITAKDERAILAAFAALSPPTSDERLRPMEAAPKDERYILAVYKSLDGYAQNLHGRVFAIRHEGETPSGYDLGWTLFPGHGGVPDKCFSGWMPLPAALNEGAA